jgi:hypothetical protein
MSFRRRHHARLVNRARHWFGHAFSAHGPRLVVA